MTRFEVMSEEKARRIAEDRQAALVAIAAGTETSVQRSLFMAESHNDAQTAYRRLRPVVTDEERDWRRAFQSYRAQGADIAEAAALANEATGRKSS